MARSKNCRKCGNYIPLNKTIDGKVRNFENRKFCLDCSPFNGHNTKSDDPSRPKGNRKNRYKNFSPEEKVLHTARVYKHGLDRKAKLIEMAGGGCIKCGYNKCQRALTFHHRDPEQKEFSLGLNSLWSKSWERIVLEFDKCDLLCIRCHMEVEDNIALIKPGTYKEILDRIQPRPIKQIEKCPVCQKDVYGTRHCSKECHTISRRKVIRPEKEVLAQRIGIMSWIDIGKEYGVSDNAVRKWARSYDLM